ncbi:hypothetical protein BAUCODRAFT_119348 [Baudoinia panamericana UAMH 10762]|uniref:Major facilitator superfamily (MFS) profile domain-containing protein n=1 Tax=Baudoinia panamericana (strain UAMH 10762) TaxID=717646 RepID=M2LYI6_BAUPA|nr:uncharacterized protein BAUCODRAFT_119348 [Baudoinia panamericana UAMH 10762]EMC99772.1 hypothetical protein BAUCODRAFT_119348 [Baudoinia panamericana UAMH 10762]
MRLHPAKRSKPAQQLTLTSSEPTPSSRTTTPLTRTRAIIVITQLAGINFVSSFGNGLLTTGLPAISASLSLKPNLLVWPASAFYLTSSSCLLIAGSIADISGPRTMNLIGCFLLACFILGSGLSRTGIEIIMFRAMTGVASALAVPSAISIVSTSLPDGKPRNIGFACLGLAQPLGFSFGLVLGGVLISTIGWRAGYYICGSITFILFFIGIWSLPPMPVPQTEIPKWKRLATEIDWIGGALISTSIALLSYVLAMLSVDLDHIRHASNIALLILSLAFIPAFIYWVHHQEKRNKPALIPNSIWSNRAFSSMCTMILLVYATINPMELFSSLFFQTIQSTTALRASLRLLPNLLVGAAVHLLTGLIVDRVPVLYAVLISSGLCALSPLLMAIVNPAWPYWYDAFFAQALSPVSVDVLFTVGLLVVSDVFPTRTQALAGAVFNTLGQLGSSIGLTSMAVISSAVTQDSGYADESSKAAIMAGYRADFWTMFACMVGVCVIGGWGLRGLGKVGLKRD